MSWTINEARGHGEVPAEDRQAVALYDALPSRLAEFLGSTTLHNTETKKTITTSNTLWWRIQLYF